MPDKNKNAVFRILTAALCAAALLAHVATLALYISLTVNTDSPFGSIYIPVSAICTVLSAICLALFLKRKKEAAFPLSIFSFIVTFAPLGILLPFARLDDFFLLPFYHVFVRFLEIALSLLAMIFLGVYNEKPKNGRRDERRN